MKMALTLALSLSLSLALSPSLSLLSSRFHLCLLSALARQVGLVHNRPLVGVLLIFLSFSLRILKQTALDRVSTGAKAG